MKKYICEMAPEEVAKLLQEGKIIKDFTSDAEYKLINGLLYNSNTKSLGGSIYLDDKVLYFEIEEETIKEHFEITETGLYKTRDGSRAFVAYIEDVGPYPVKGKIEGTSEEFSWTRKGFNIDNEIFNTDIISKWEE